MTATLCITVLCLKNKQTTNKKKPRLVARSSRRAGTRETHDARLSVVYRFRGVNACALNPNMSILDHLVVTPDIFDDPVEGFTPVEKALPDAIVAAQGASGSFLEALGVTSDEELVDHMQISAAREAFSAVVAPSNDKKDAQARSKLLRVNTPPAVRHLVGMLTAYDWEFIEHAKELRGYAVSKIVEETSHPDARIRLRALELLGKVTEVGLFTERIEIKKSDISDADIDAKLMEKLTSLRLIEDAVEKKADAQDVDVQVVEVKE